MSVVREITCKFLSLKKAPRSIAAMTVISIIGIAIGVATLTVTYSVANGFSKAYREAIMGFTSHVVLLSIGEIEDYQDAIENLEKYKDEISSINPFIYREGLLIHNGKIRGVMVKGGKSVRNDELQGSGTLLGSDIARELKISKGDKIRLMLPEHWQNKKGARFAELKVDDTFSSGMYDFDSQFLLLDLEHAQKLFNAENKITGIEIKLKDAEKTDEFVAKIEDEFIYPFYASTWKELNRSLFDAIKLEKIMFVIIMGTLVIVAAFNIIGTVMLRILYKTTDISVLRALGMKKRALEKVFTWQGVAVGAFGTLIGLIISFIIIWSIIKFEWISVPEEIYLIKTLPVCISLKACVMISAFSILVSYITSMLASKRVTEVPVTKGLHRI